MKEKWKEFKEIIDNNNRFTITTHVNPDGDAVGSELALYKYLISLGKDVRVINNNIYPSVFGFLKDIDETLELYESEHDEWIMDSDVVIVLDISTLERLGGMEKVISKSTATKVCIDHHIGNGEFADLAITNTSAAATAELIFEFITTDNGSLPENIAEPLYVAFVTDTDSFSKSNTTKKTHEIVSELMKFNIDPIKVFSEVYQKSTWERIELYKMALSTIRKECRGGLAWFKVDADMVEKSGASREEMGGFVEFLMTIKDVELGIFFLEVPYKGTKVSIRSRGDIDSNKLAAKFGGGGHMQAAGIRMFDTDLESVIELVLKEARCIFKK